MRFDVTKIEKDDKELQELLDILYNMNVKDRYNYILNDITEEDYDESKINFDFIMSLLRYNPDKMDFNILPDKFYDLDEFKDFKTVLESAYDSKSPFIRRNCRDCGEKFFIYKSELEFYESRGLSVPKRCKSCRIKNKSFVV